MRTIVPELVKYFTDVCVHTETAFMKGLVADVKIIPKKHIESLHLLTPAVIKDSRGYWRQYMSAEEYENRIKVNLLKQWNYFEGEKLDEDFNLFYMIEFYNKKPISVEYKNIKLLGDKFKIYISDDLRAQNLAYMVIGTGILENTSRGFGSANYRWL